MSGFAGIVRIASSSESDEADRSAIERMARAIAFRGPDSQQQSHLAGASFAFSLLTTGPASQESAQPYTVDGETWFLGEARCDGRDEVARVLARSGVEVSGSASSEQLVLRYFAKFGESGLPDLHGDFSFILWDPRLRKLIAFRDLTGSRPFYYSHHDGAVIFSNTLQAILAHPAISRSDFDLQFIADFLLGSPHHDPERTIYKEIRRLSAGSILEFSDRGLSVRRIAHLPIEEMLSFKSDEAVVEHFGHLFKEAVGDRLPDGNTAIFLSGGLDSTSIAASAVDQRKIRSPEGPLNLYALNFDLQPLFSDEEGILAGRFAKTLDLPFESAAVGNFLPFQDNQDSVLPEPTCGPYLNVQRFCFSRTVARGRVVFTGDGGDEILNVKALPYLRYLSSRSNAGRAGWVLLKHALSSRKIPYLGTGIRAGLLGLIGRRPPKPVFPSWLTPEAETRFDLRRRFVEISSEPTSKHPFSPSAYGVFNGQTFANVMEEQDAGWTNTLVESRAPFLDRRLLAFLLRLPAIPWLMKKELLRRASKGLLPEEIRRRPKAPLRLDPLLVQVASGKWSPPQSGALPDPLPFFVDSTRFTASLSQPLDLNLYTNLPPIALAQWLQNVEKSKAIG